MEAKQFYFFVLVASSIVAYMEGRELPALGKHPWEERERYACVNFLNYSHQFGFL